MSAGSALGSFASRRWTPATVAWVGGLFIAVIVSMAGYDMVGSYRDTVRNTGRELDSQARLIAEQTARSVQAVDVVLRHLAKEFREGSLAALSREDLRMILKEQAVGLVQIEGLLVINADGSLRASSYLSPAQDASVNISDGPTFQALRSNRIADLYLDRVQVSRVDGQRMFPMTRRLETSSGAFAGGVGARGRIAYFQDFYRNVRLDEGTTVALTYEDGTLMARHPPADSALGKPLPVSDVSVAALRTRQPAMTRAVSPIDGADRFVALQPVPDYPLAVFVTRDAAVALSAWRTQTLGTAVRTFALSALAMALILLLMRQLSRLNAARESLEASRERFALAVAGSGDGIWDFDFTTQIVFASARAREILGMPPGPESLPADQWFGTVKLHPEDAPKRTAAMEAHIAGNAPAYDGEFRVMHPDGNYRWFRVHGLCVRDANGKPHRMAGSITDIDARKRAEEALRESEERFAIAVAGSDDGIWDFDFAHGRAFNSARGRTLIGMPPYPENEPLDDWLRKLPTYLHPDDVERRHAALAAHLEGRAPAYEVEVRHRQPNGSYRWLRVRGICVRGPDGKPLRMAGSASDIDARKRAEEALRESEERFALAVEGSNDGIVDWDIVRDRMYLSPRAMAILGIQSDASIRPRVEWRDLITYHPEDAPRVRDEVVAFLAGNTETREAEYRILVPGGEYRWIRHRNKCIRDARGLPTRLSGSVSDIDARKKAEGALRESEERYQLAVDGANQGLWDWDLRTDLLFLSPRAQEFLGLAPSDRPRPRREWLGEVDIHSDDQAVARAALSEHLEGRTAHLAVEYRVRHSSGDWRWFRQRAVALRDARGRPYRLAGSVEDITGYKQAEAHRARLEGQLLQSKKLEAIGTLAGGIAHDFNNILAAILGYGEMAQKSAASGTALRRHVDAVVGAGMRAKSLVERILAFSRSGVGERVPVHVQSIVAEALDLVAASLPAHVRVERRLEAGDAAVVGDPTQIHQVVMNLCANAAQAMKSTGALTVSLDVVDKAHSMAATSALAGGRYVRLSVRDTGVGIAPNMLERIFDPFFTTKDVGVGTGLGLSLVHGIVTDLGGGIDVDSRPGEGSTFIVYLPWSSAAAAPAAVEERIPGGAGETILLVDDEEVLVHLGEEMIAMLGYEPVGFTSSSAALAAFRAAPERFNAVLSDESMPEMTGSELARAIRAVRADLPIVLMSGVVSPILSARAREIGVLDVIAKPLVSRDIARTLAAALRPESRSDDE